MDTNKVSTLFGQASDSAGRLANILHRFADFGLNDSKAGRDLQREYNAAKVQLNHVLGQILAQYPQLIQDATPSPATPAPAPAAPTPARPAPAAPMVPAVVLPPTTPTANPNRFNGLHFFVNPSGAAAHAAAIVTPDPHDQKVFQFFASKPVAFWYGGWGGALDGLKAAVDAARKAGQVLIVVLYNIPARDASGGYSAGGTSYAAYGPWRDQAIQVVGDTPTVWIVEPDALPDLTAVGDQQQSRLDLIKDTGLALTKQPNSWVYLDAGNYSWQSAETMADRLTKAGIANVDGFALNVSGFGWQDQTMAYGNKLSGLLGGKHFVVDTSRNGAGPWTNPAGPQWDDWCNPPGRLVGLPPQIQPTDLCDAFMWIKPAGESDGNCKGGPNAGEWYGAYAVELARVAVPR